MLEKIKALPEKVSFGIGISLILISGFLFLFDNWIAMLVKGLVFGIAILFILSAADRRQSYNDSKN
jgi:hypothetical protein